MRREDFGRLLRRKRLQKGLTLREFCKEIGYDPSNYSKLERGLAKAPGKEGELDKMGAALGISVPSAEWDEFCDAAAVSRGRIPTAVLDDDALATKLPFLFRLARDKNLDEADLEQIVETVREIHSGEADQT